MSRHSNEVVAKNRLRQQEAGGFPRETPAFPGKRVNIKGLKDIGPDHGCKTVYPGSIPGVASTHFSRKYRLSKISAVRAFSQLVG
jgi:hypothetical protein